MPTRPLARCGGDDGTSFHRPFPGRPGLSQPCSQRRGLKNTAESTAGIIPGDRGKDDGSWFRRPLHIAQAVW